MDVDKAHAAGEPGDRIGNPLLPAPTPLLLAPVLQQCLDVPVDHMGQIGCALPSNVGHAE
jgi:hypothetical protein